MQSNDTLPLLRSVGELSQLALAIGTSIDLTENCEYFFKHLMSRKNLIAAHVWTAKQRDGVRGYERVYSYPSLDGATWVDNQDVDWTALLNGKDLRLFKPENQAAIHQFIEDTDAAFVIFHCPQDSGFVVLHSYSWMKHDLSAADDSQLALLLEKFLRSVKGCTDHQELLLEMEAHKRSREREQDLQHRLNRMQRMEHISDAIGHAAHDLNNLFCPVLTYPEMIVAGLPADTPSSVIRDLKAIEVSTQAAVGVLNDLLSISRSGRRLSEDVYLPDVVAGFSKLASFRKLEQSHPEISFTFDCEENVPIFTGAVVQCTQAILNLVTNASQEIPGAGEVATRVSTVCYTDPFSGYEEIPPGEYVVLEVRDTADGIPPEIFDRILEPFVSRKEMGTSGSGLGLAVVYGVVKHAEGFIDVQTEIDSGTCFRLHFPCKQTKSPQVRPIANQASQ